MNNFNWYGGDSLAKLIRETTDICKTGRSVRHKSTVLMMLALIFAYCMPAVQATDLKSHPIVFIEDGEFSRKLHLPVYEWYPKDVSPDCLVLAVHGLTLHGTSYELLGKAFASGGYYVAAPDMRGFGKCRSDKDHHYCVGKDCKHKINYDKSYDDIVGLARSMKEKYPKAPLIVLGESLGATMCVRLAGQHPELVNGIIVSGPAVRINPLMYLHPASLWAGLVGFFVSPHFKINLNPFIRNLVSNDPEVSTEMLQDPLVAKDLTAFELLRSESFVGKTLKYAHTIESNTPVLILQGSKDRCVTPTAVVKLTNEIGSSDQTMRWLGRHGHLLLETHFIRAATIDAVADWLDDHRPERLAELMELQKQIESMGGKSATQD